MSWLPTVRLAGRRLATGRSWPVTALALLVAALPPLPLAGQGSELSVEVGGSTIRPPEGVEGDAARFLVAGIRAMRFDLGGTGVSASFMAGRSLEESTGGDFLSGNLEAALWKRLGGGWSGGLEAKGFAFRVQEPFLYTSLGVEGEALLRYGTRKLSATLAGIVGSGFSEAELQGTPSGAGLLVRDELWRYGATAEVLAGSGKLMAGVAAGIHESLGGSYSSLGARVLVGGGGPVLELRADVWQTPLGNQTTGGAAFVVPVGALSFRGFLGRTEPDPLTLAEPGGGAGGILVGWRILGSDPLPAPLPPLHEVLEVRGETARVRIHVEPLRRATQMEIMGDFTLWEPVAMRAEGDRWEVELEIPLGTHHFGFVLDGEWYLPDDTPDAVPDEWGRTNATMVIER